MATTYTLISSNVLTSSAASVTFSSIPSTYTDLVLRVSARTDTGNDFDNLLLTFNGTGGTVYSYTDLRGDGAAATSARGSNAANTQIGFADGSTATANTFSSHEIYIPSYTASQSKPLSAIGMQENNNATAYMRAYANLFRDNTAISSITINKNSGAGTNFVSGSSFYLYGVKNS